MRQVALFLLLAVALAAGAADVWRWTDADGVVHYSDQPRAGAERVTVSAPRPSGNTAPEAAQGVESGGSEEPQQERTRPFAYTRCTVASPASDEVFQGVQDIEIDLAIEPELQAGHRVQVFVNGALRADWPPASTSHTLTEVFRGSHTIAVRILDANARVMCSGAPITFHLRQPSVLSPTSPLAPRPPAPRGGG